MMSGLETDQAYSYSYLHGTTVMVILAFTTQCITAAYITAILCHTNISHNSLLH